MGQVAPFVLLLLPSTASITTSTTMKEELNRRSDCKHIPMMKKVSRKPYVGQQFNISIVRCFSDIIQILCYSGNNFSK